MKQQPDAVSAHALSRHDRRRRRGRSFPRIDCEFQPRWTGGSFGDSDTPPRRPGFDRLAREAMRADATHSFRFEAAVFGLVSLVCAWPIGIMLHEVIRLLK